MSRPGDQGWSFATTRERPLFAACRESAAPDVEHALTGDATLCGISRERVTVYRHPFFLRRPDACVECARRAAAVPTEPGVQERLHRRLEDAVPRPLRDELLELLRRGAEVRLWVDGPAHRIIRYHAELDRIIEGRESTWPLVNARSALGLARVVAADGREFVVFLPEGNIPFVTRAEPRTSRPTDA
ncbi:hypothetical protein [Embleya sp. AB8]|uniref:hypothetical protein n=1 Tax=Embleya sp. AB8 TaxID=3156304 RepID=UPI003C764575